MNVQFARPPAFRCKIRKSFQLDRNCLVLTIGKLEGACATGVFGPSFDVIRVVSRSKFLLHITVTIKMVAPLRQCFCKDWPSLAVFNPDTAGNSVVRCAVSDFDLDLAIGKLCEERLRLDQPPGAGGDESEVGLH